MSKLALQRFRTALQHQEPEQVPIVIWDIAPFLTRYKGIKTKEYYLNPEIKMKIQTSFQEEFPEFVCIPGVWADFGATIEASAFGCHVVWYEDDAPYVEPVINDIKDISKLKPVDPKKDGLMPTALDQYHYMWKHLNKKYIEEYGFLDGIAVSMGPLEVSALILGYGNLLLAFYDYPELVHKLFSMVTEVTMSWLRAQEKVNGTIRHLFIADHFPTQVGPRHVEEFCLPYLKKIYSEFPRAIKMYHNEGKSTHFIARIPDFGADYFHFGDVDLKLAKDTLRGKVTLMGNLHPVNVLVEGTPEVVKREALHCLSLCAPGGGFFLSSGGGMAPGTPKANLLTLIQAVEEYQLKSGKR